MFAALLGSLIVTVYINQWLFVFDSFFDQLR